MGDRLVAIGEALIDFIPDKKGCEFDQVTGFAPKLGGAPANVCGAYAKLGGRARLLTQLGDDPFGHKIVKELAEDHVDTSCISLTEQANTALAFVSLGKDGNRTFSFYRKPSADMLYTAEQIREDYFEEAYVLHFCSVSLGDFPMRDAHREAIRIAHEKGILTSFDPNLRFQLWESREALKQTVWEFIPQSDILKLSDEELEFLTGETDIRKALPSLFTGEVKLVVYTCGGGGAYAYTRDVWAFAEAKKVNALDTTGAGDGFIGSFLWKLHELGATRENLQELAQEILAESLDFSNEFCGRSVTLYGAIASYPDMKDYKRKQS